MNQHNKVEILDKSGWRKEVLVEKTIVHIGSNSRNDIVLEPGRGAGVAPLHAQLIISTSGAGCQLVNLGNADILLGVSGDQVLSPHSTINIVSGDVFKLGEFTLVFYGDGGAAGDFAGRSQNIGLSVSLPQTRLGPNRSLDGVLTVGNLGDRGGAQFNLELEGLEPDCYDIEPGPILPAGAEKELFFHLYHRGLRPLAGDCRVTIRATAPRAYPGEQATASQVIHILPFYRHELRLLPQGRVSPSTRVEERQVPTPPSAKWAPEAEAGPPSQAEDWWAPTPTTDLRVATERAPQARAAASPVGSSFISLSAQVEEEEAPEAETVPPSAMEDWWIPEAEASPQVEEGVAETEAGLPAQVEETPEAESVPPARVEEERVPEVQADLQPQVEEGVAEAGVGPPVQVEEEQIPEVQADLPQAEERVAETVPPAPMEDEWALEAQAGPEGQAEEQGVLELKTSPPPEEEEAPEAEAGPPPSAEDWWASEAEAGPEGQAEEQGVLELKASPPPSAEDWWASSQTEDEPAPEE